MFLLVFSSNKIKRSEREVGDEHKVNGAVNTRDSESGNCAGRVKDKVGHGETGRR